MTDEIRYCIDCRWSQQLRWDRLCLRWMPPAKLETGQEACGEYQAKVNTWQPVPQPGHTGP